MPGETEESRIRGVIARWEKAIQAGDEAGILANHTDDILLFDVPEPLQSIGIEQYQRSWELFFRYGAPDATVFVIEGLQVTAGSDVGFATSLLRIGGSQSATCRLTIGLKKVRGQWLIAHEHHSAPHAITTKGEDDRAVDHRQSRVSR